MDSTLLTETTQLTQKPFEDQSSQLWHKPVIRDVLSEVTNLGCKASSTNMGAFDEVVTSIGKVSYSLSNLGRCMWYSMNSLLIFHFCLVLRARPYWRMTSTRLKSSRWGACDKSWLSVFSTTLRMPSSSALCKPTDQMLQLLFSKTDWNGSCISAKWSQGALQRARWLSLNLPGERVHAMHLRRSEKIRF